MAISHCILTSSSLRMAISTLLLTSSGQEWQFHICYWHIVVKNGNFTLLLTSNDEWISVSHCYWHLMMPRMAVSHCYWHLVDQEWQFHIATDMLVVKNSNFTLLLTSSGQEWQLHIATDVQWSWMAISHCYWHVVVKNVNLTSATDI